ncbi:hypothetical protein TeGR_g7511, partial [Tetraparma gracilis]
MRPSLLSLLLLLLPRPCLPLPSRLPNPYKTLGLPPSASASDIKRAYRKLSLRHHPDKTTSLPPAKRASSESKFKAANEAYQVLSDPARKRGYDEHGTAEPDAVPAGFGFPKGFGQGEGVDVAELMRAFNKRNSGAPFGTGSSPFGGGGSSPFGGGGGGLFDMFSAFSAPPPSPP